jgi:aminoglycoside 6'-N-acetyltransferase
VGRSGEGTGSHYGRPQRTYDAAMDRGVLWSPQSHFRHLPDEAKAIDAFIGEPDMLGCGHGRAFLRVFAEMLISEGAPVVAIDPNLNNLRARRAYARAGFVVEEVVETPEGPSVLMLFQQTPVPT